MHAVVEGGVLALLARATAIISPEGVGFPCRRPRHYTVLMRRYLSSQFAWRDGAGDLFYVLGRECCAHGDALLSAREDERSVYKVVLASFRRNYRASPVDHKLEEVLTACQAARPSSRQPWFSDVMQNAVGGASAASAIIPCLLMSSLLVCHQGRRILCPSDHFAAQAMPMTVVVSKGGYKLQCPFHELLEKPRLDDKRLPKLVGVAGHAMNAAVLGALVGYTCSRLPRVDFDIAWQMSSEFDSQG